jgi:O-acetylhomoserine (thiol)-lyase
MRSDTVVLHAGFDMTLETRALVVALCQTVANRCDSPENVAEPFVLAAGGGRQNRIADPISTVLERRVAVLEESVEPLTVSSGQAAIFRAIGNLSGLHCNLGPALQPRGTVRAFFPHVPGRHGIPRVAGATIAVRLLSKTVHADADVASWR